MNPDLYDDDIIEKIHTLVDEYINEPDFVDYDVNSMYTTSFVLPKSGLNVLTDQEQEWLDIIQAAENNVGLQDLLHQVKMYYILGKE